MKNALVIKDLDMSKELDRAALAKLVGGRNTYASGGWARSNTAARLGSGWKRDAAAGGYCKTWTQSR